MFVIIRWSVFICLACMTVLMINKGIDLWALGSNVDGDGIGIQFLGLEIDERVPEGRIPTYAIGFFITSLIPLLFALYLLRKLFKR